MEPAQNGGTEEKKEAAGVRRIRTYQDDLARVITTDRTSLADIALAENERRVKSISLPPEPEPRPRVSKRVLLAGGGIALVILLASIGGVFLSGRQGGGSAGPQSGPAPTELLSTDRTEPVAADALGRDSFFAAFAKERDGSELPLSSVVILSLTTGAGRAARPFETADLFSLLGVTLPPDLSRTLGGRFALGLVGFAPNIPFLLLKTDYYQSAIAGMLEWEKTMDGDIGPLFRPASAESGTPFGPRPVWDDETIGNRDARVLRDENGNMLLFYTFLDNSTILIASGSGAADVVSRRLYTAPAQ